MPEKFENPKLQEEKEKALPAGKQEPKLAQSAGLELETEIIKRELPVPGEKEADIFVADVFDPEEELEKIKKLPREEKREALREYKEKLMRQKEGLAEFQEKLTKLIMEDPEISDKKLKDETMMAAEKYGLTKSQVKSISVLVQRYLLRHIAIENTLKQYKDPRDLYNAAFGQYPEGKVEVRSGPVSVYFKCYNSRDYALIHSLAFMDKREVNEHDIDSANLSGGCCISQSLLPNLNEAITAENTALVKDEFSKEIFVHEEQHAIKKLFWETVFREQVSKGRFKNTNNEDEVRLFVERYLRGQRLFSENRLKDELLAHFKQGMNPGDIFSELTKPESQGGIYDYLLPLRERVGGIEKQLKNYPGIAMKAGKKVLIDEYNDLVAAGIYAYESLIKDAGFSIDKAIAFLIKEPVIKWPKIVARLYEQRKNKKR